jgi:phosphatidylserine/phosphatidylglycerophosphate/cardiolipin synthase-like enzyme
MIARAFAAIFESGWSSSDNRIDFGDGWNMEWIYPVATPINTPTWVAKTEDTIIGLIDSARNKIQVSAYVFTGSPASLLNAVIYAANRGVNVQIIIDAEYRGYLPDSVNYEPNIQIKAVNIGGAEHSKVVIVDGQKAYIGSANWTNASMRGRREVGVSFEDQTLASTLEEIFNKDWESRYAAWVTGQSGSLLPYVICAIAVGFITAAIIIFVWRRTKRKSQ